MTESIREARSGSASVRSGSGPRRARTSSRRAGPTSSHWVAPRRSAYDGRTVAYLDSVGNGEQVALRVVQAGVIRTETLQELFDVAALLAHQPLPRGRRVAAVERDDGHLIARSHLGHEARRHVPGTPHHRRVERDVVEQQEHLARAFATEHALAAALAALLEDVSRAVHMGEAGRARE